MKLYQKDIKSEKDFYREITRQIKESKSIVLCKHEIFDAVPQKGTLFRVIKMIRYAENMILDTCVHYLSSRKCFGEKKKELLHVLKIYLVYLFRIEQIFNSLLDWRSPLITKVENILLGLYFNNKHVMNQQAIQI